MLALRYHGGDSAPGAPAPGTLDESFGQGGIVSTMFGRNPRVCANAAAVDPSTGKIVLAGTSTIYIPKIKNIVPDLALARYSASGVLDTSFGGQKPNAAGTVQTDFGGRESLSDVLVQPDGKIVVAGKSPTLVRYNANGTLDDGGRSDSTPGDRFGTKGSVSTLIAGAAFDARAISLDAQGRILAVGHVETSAGRDIVLARYQSDGNLDTGFGQGGIVTTSVGYNEYARAYAVYPAGSALAGYIVVAGDTFTAGTGTDLCLVRYAPDGTLDPSFDGDGKVAMNFDWGTEAHSVAIQTDGSIVVAGNIAHDGIRDFLIARYTDLGALDTGFGVTEPNLGHPGIVVTHFPDSSGSGANWMSIQPSGKIVAAGYAVQGNSRVALARYNANGTLDDTFGDPAQPAGGVSSLAAQASATQADSAALAAAAYYAQPARRAWAADQAFSELGSTSRTNYKQNTAFDLADFDLMFGG